jgi:hypothetical protein
MNNNRGTVQAVLRFYTQSEGNGMLVFACGSK